MGISQKIRSLHCGFQQGLGFEVLAGENVILIKNVPFELEDIIAKWIAALPDELMSGPCLLYTSPSPRDRQKSRMPSSA